MWSPPSRRSAAGSAEVSDWREWEIELVDGSAALIEAAEDRIRGAGASPSPWPSKLAQALGGRLATPPDPMFRGARVPAAGPVTSCLPTSPSRST